MRRHSKDTSMAFNNSGNSIFDAPPPAAEAPEPLSYNPNMQYQQPNQGGVGGGVNNIARPPSVFSPAQPSNPTPAMSTTFQSPTHLDFFNSNSMPDAGDYDNTPMQPPMEFPSTNSMNGMMDSSSMYEDYDNEPPLLEELDINFSHILGKTKAVLQPFGKATNQEYENELMMDSDLTGPVFFLICLGCSLLLQGKIQFGYIYGFGIFCCVAMYTLLNLLSPPQSPTIDFWLVVSTLGYCLLPVVIVAAVGIVFTLTGWVGTFIAMFAVSWCTYTATRNFEATLKMNKQRYLIAYPIALLYSCFVLIAIF